MRYIAVGVCVRPSDGSLLVEHGTDRVSGARFYRAIGGACEPGETADAAVVREWREEFALEVHMVRMLGILDNQFVYEGKAGHESVTAFEIALVDPARYVATRLRESIQWGSRTSRPGSHQPCSGEGYLRSIRLTLSSFSEPLANESLRHAKPRCVPAVAAQACGFAAELGRKPATTFIGRHT